MAEKPLGFIGFGLMGQGFTRRLAELGHGVVGFDIDPAKVAAAAAWGVKPAKSAADVVEACDIILACVINTAAVEDAAIGPRGALAAGKLDGKVFVDHSTTELEATKRVAAALAARGMMFVD
ncbi:MAG: NAD(P)-binding domain-containing protein, partial [Pseudolabrys sp.]|nr:NAD(P)-binding domain-containing protein [Pseudolabrys sp.]